MATKVDTLLLQVLQSLSSLTGALRTMMKGNHCALLFSLESANSKDQQENGALVAITSATSVVALGISLFTSATTLTEYGIWRFHRYRIQIDLCSWSFLQAGALCLPLWPKLGFSVSSVDHENSGAVAPIVTLDLTTQSGVAIL